MDLFGFFKKEKHSLDKENVNDILSQNEVSYPPPSQIEKNVSLEFFLKKACIPGNEENLKKNFLSANMVYGDLFAPIIRLPWGTCSFTEKSIKAIFQLLLLEVYRNIHKCEESLMEIIKKNKYEQNNNNSEKKNLYIIAPSDLYFYVEVINTNPPSKEDFGDENIQSNTKQYYVVNLETLIESFRYAASEFVQTCGMVDTGNFKPPNIHVNNLKNIFGFLK